MFAPGLISCPPPLQSGYGNGFRSHNHTLFPPPTSSTAFQFSSSLAGRGPSPPAATSKLITQNDAFSDLMNYSTSGLPVGVVSMTSSSQQYPDGNDSSCRAAILAAAAAAAAACGAPAPAANPFLTSGHAAMSAILSGKEIGNGNQDRRQLPSDFVESTGNNVTGRRTAALNMPGLAQNGNGYSSQRRTVNDVIG